MSAGNDDGNSFYAAMARTAARGVALYFSRPVRLFRPSKGMWYRHVLLMRFTDSWSSVSGWQILNGLASQHGQSVTPQYVRGLIKQQGVRTYPRSAENREADRVVLVHGNPETLCTPDDYKPRPRFSPLGNLR